MRPLLEYLGHRLAELDQLLRGEATRPAALKSDKLEISARGLALVAVLLAMLYGACMGSYSLLKEVPADLNDPYGPYLQVLASIVKTPALFVLTLVVTLPSLYVFNALVGSRLTLIGMARLLVASLAVNVAVLASLGTIVAFFSLTTQSYAFIRLLNVAAFSIAGVLGLMFLLQTLHRLSVLDLHQRPSEPEPSPLEAGEPADHEIDGALDLAPQDKPPSALDMPEGQVLGQHTQVVFRCWIVLFALVGAQMGWVLRPFIGSPNLEFTFFRERQSNFFAAVFKTVIELLSGS